ncbi:S-layer homology domain-containing protein [Solibacillus sp. MA9]|uniref:S-layer homology domain-containing protein n=1 Tax=Solibacillus palustris TaxID=2908203 RepID=A0ABS9U7D6_9BACL|nr:S-layer homology domain-containing protein [Solibacillus sp. MA9]MCH7320257.1 S-layer homology domain-containing protein [Solibacillus sp. MA9]
MNQTKKILAALVAVPASVVVADGALAAEEMVSFTVSNEFVSGNNINVEKVEVGNLNAQISEKIFEKLSSLNTNKLTIVLDNTNLQKVKEDVEKVFQYLKTNINGKTNNIDNLLLYGLFKDAKVVAKELDSSKISLELNFQFYAEASYKTNLVEPVYKELLAKNPELRLTSTDIEKIKAVHDYIAGKVTNNPNGHDLINLSIGSGLSSHSYSIWTYLLLQKLDANLDVNYIYGMSKGKLSSWNAVNIEGKWYPLDVYNNDRSNLIQYKYFLTDDNQTGKREIYFGNEDRDFASFDIFANIVNPVYTTDKKTLFYVNENEGGKIYKIENWQQADATTESISDTETSQISKIQVPGTKFLYFVNTNDGNYLYQYSISDGKFEKVIQENIESFSFNKNEMTYKVTNESSSKKIQTGSGVGAGLVEYVTNFIKSIDYKTGEQIDASYKNKVMEARRLFNLLTKKQQTEAESKLLKDSQTNWLLHLESSLVDANDSEVTAVVGAIQKIDINNTTFFDVVKEARTEYDRLSNEKKEKVYNYNVLVAAEAQISAMTNLENEIKQFVEANIEEANRGSNFYNDLSKLVDRYNSLLQILKRNEFDVTYRALIGLGNSGSYMADVTAVREILETLNIDSKAYLDDVTSLKVKYEQLSNAQKGILNEDEKASIANHLTQMEKMNQVVEEIQKYKSDIESINNKDPLNPAELTTEFINKIKRAKELLQGGLKPSQWNKLSVSNPTDFIAKVDGFLKRVEDAQGDLSGAALKVTGKLKAFDGGILENLVSSTNPQDYTDKVTELKDMLEGTDFAGSPEKLQIIFSMLPEEIVKIWDRHLKLSRGFKVNVESFVVSIDTLDKKAERTEAEVDKLIEDYNQLDPIFQHYVTNFEKLEEMKKLFKDDEEKKNAEALIKKIEALLLKQETAPPVTYAEVKELWEQYENGSSIFKATVEGAEKSFSDFRKLWEKLKAEEDAIKAEEQKIKDLIEEIKALTKDSTKEELLAVKAKYDALTEEQQKLITNFSHLQKLLIALEEKENDQAAAKDKAAAEEVTRLIAELNNESTAVEIIAARTAYEALSEDAKKYILKSTLDALVYYETRIKELTEIAKKEAAVVQDRIDRITSSYTEAQIKNIRNAYNALSQLAKEYVTNLQKLIDAEKNIIYQDTVVKQAKLDANAFDVYMNDINRNSTKAEIAKARAYYNSLSYEARKYVTTYEKLVRLETMWTDPKYIDLVYTYYPDYIHDIKPGGIVIEKPKYDSIYIPDDSETGSSSSSITASTDWTTYETMKYQNGRYTTSITTTQAQSIKDRSKILKADDIEIIIPTADLYAATATVGVTVSVANNQLNIQFKEGKQAKIFSEYVEIHVPFSVLNGNASQIIERVSASNSSASFKIEGSNFIIRTKSSGIFKTATASVYSDLPNNAQGTAMRELAKRGILFDTNLRLSQSYKQVTKFEVASMMATALDLSSSNQSSYQDVTNEQDLSHVQGLLEAGIMSGFTSSYFNGEGTVTKQEAAIMISNMYRYLNRDVSRAYSGFQTSFKDVSYLSLEARQSIAILELFGVVKATDSFEPTKQLTRGEFAELFYNALTAIDYL